ncbi:hypothetical protein HJG60_008734 [Phyllostomus discolor]|uniref:Uncharacterized protein n=1 Tax=Phyllostomus discolor TaxID=89673 RepID=A0A833YW62_9CHIR|nr:hypothetical protein HJG60_008734 [Phyllostomus discolor]
MQGTPPPPRRPRPAPPTHVTSGPAPTRPAPSALLPLAVREALRLSYCLRRHSRPRARALSPVFTASAATAGGIRGSLPGLALCLSRCFSLPPAVSLGRGSPAAEPLEASVLVLLPTLRVLEKQPGNGASRFQR